MVYRTYTEKKPGMSTEAARLLQDLRDFLGVHSLTGLRILNRYDLEGIDAEVYERVRNTIVSEPQSDVVWDENLPALSAGWQAIAVEALPGQFDQRADSLAQCVAMMTEGERPRAASAKVYLLKGELTDDDLRAIRSHLINPVESREADFEKPSTLRRDYPEPAPVETVDGFIQMNDEEVSVLRARMDLAMDDADLLFLQTYFRETEKRDPTVTEIRVIDTYWSDHCRHTTFLTEIKEVDLDDPVVCAAWNRYLDARQEVFGENADKRPITLMDMATLGARLLKRRGLLPDLDESEEINACSIHVPAQVDGKEQDWLLLFKNETHNHPTEIEPFGGAATCIGGCIRDPLSGRAYVHQAMRVTGCADPRAPFSSTMTGKLPQRRIAQTAAEGYSSYGNQIGLATGHVAEVYHPGFAAKHLETGAVVGAVRADRVRRERPAPGDVVILLGGRTGRDGIGGATGSSKKHNLSSLETMASEVQKGNAPEERKLQRLFRNPDVLSMIKRCNDFGAGGVAVAVGELADGLEINLDAVRKKYAGLDGTEIAISESQERMAVVVGSADVDSFIAAAAAENLEAYPVAVVTNDARVIMTWRGEKILDLSRSFLNTNGARKNTSVKISREGSSPVLCVSSLREAAASLPFASRRGLAERFDSTVGAGTVLMPFGGSHQRTASQVMAALLPVAPGEKTTTASLMAWDYDPDVMSMDQYAGAYLSVQGSLAKLVAAGGNWKKAYLTFQEYFPRLGEDPTRWGQPVQALLGALDAQMHYGRPAIGGKDSMSGSFMDLDVPPTLISFAVVPAPVSSILSSEFKQPGSPVYMFMAPDAMELEDAWDAFLDLARQGKVLSASAVERTPAETALNMALGNEVGFEASSDADLWWRRSSGAILAELKEEVDVPSAKRVGMTCSQPWVRLGGSQISIADALALSEDTLRDVYPLAVETEEKAPLLREFGPPIVRMHSPVSVPRPRVLIPVFPGTNCEYDSARVCLEAGLDPDILVVRNLTPDDLAASLKAFEEKLEAAQILFLPGGFSGGDEPEGSAKFIVSLLRSPRISDAVHNLLQIREGLVLGICNGFQALIKTGLVPYGEIRNLDPSAPTLTYNSIGRHQSMIVRTKVVSALSPWLAQTQPGEIFSVPISHGEGRFAASTEMLEQLEKNGQIVTQYVDLEGIPSMETAFNPNGSSWAVESICSPDGRVLGRMGHSERTGEDLYLNVPGNYDMGLFRSAASYFA